LQILGTKQNLGVYLWLISHEVRERYVTRSSRRFSSTMFHTLDNFLPPNWGTVLPFCNPKLEPILATIKSTGAFPVSEDRKATASALVIFE
tara:strand:+ start:200 stop:472 length:273 start_codon:yes stop_codon:yes gene_type:complete